MECLGKIFTAVGVVAITNSVPLAFVVAAIQIILELKIADYQQRRIENYQESQELLVLIKWFSYQLQCM